METAAPGKGGTAFLTQLALGDETAVVSLKALIPDRDPRDGLLNYGPESEEQQKWDDATRKAYEKKSCANSKPPRVIHCCGAWSRCTFWPRIRRVHRRGYRATRGQSRHTLAEGNRANTTGQNR